jgi:hypothetical protein
VKRPPFAGCRQPEPPLFDRARPWARERNRSTLVETTSEWRETWCSPCPARGKHISAIVRSWAQWASQRLTEVEPIAVCSMSSSPWTQRRARRVQTSSTSGESSHSLPAIHRRTGESGGATMSAISPPAARPEVSSKARPPVTHEDRGAMCARTRSATTTTSDCASAGPPGAPASIEGASAAEQGRLAGPGSAEPDRAPAGRRGAPQRPASAEPGSAAGQRPRPDRPHRPQPARVPVTISVTRRTSVTHRPGLLVPVHHAPPGDNAGSHPHTPSQGSEGSGFPGHWSNCAPRTAACSGNR